MKPYLDETLLAADPLALACWDISNLLPHRSGPNLVDTPWTWTRRGREMCTSSYFSTQLRLYHLQLLLSSPSRGRSSARKTFVPHLLFALPSPRANDRMEFLNFAQMIRLLVAVCLISLACRKAAPVMSLRRRILRYPLIAAVNGS